MSYGATNLFMDKAYGKCPIILYTKVADKIAYANSVDPDQNLHVLPFHKVFKETIAQKAKN